VTGKKHVVHVGFFERTAELLDFDNYDVSVVLDPPTAKSLPKWLRERFAAIGVIDVPDRLNLEDYDQASDQMIGLVEEFSKTLGEPSGIVGLYEHTTVPAARLREHFGLPGTDLATSALFRDKVRMKEALRGVVPLPRFWSVDSSTSQADLREIVGELPGKVVLKPKSQAASFGVEIFDSAADLLTHAETTGISDGYEVEEFVEGTVCHFDGVLRDGRLCFLNVSRYVGDCFAFQHRNQPLASVTIDDPALVARASEFTDRVLTTMGLRDSTFHLESPIASAAPSSASTSRPCSVWIWSRSPSRRACSCRPPWSRARRTARTARPSCPSPRGGSTRPCGRSRSAGSSASTVSTSVLTRWSSRTSPASARC
jgi:hypothetical protein